MTKTPTPTWEEAITSILTNLDQGKYLDSGGVPAALEAINIAVLGLVIGRNEYSGLPEESVAYIEGIRDELRAAQRRVVRGE